MEHDLWKLSATQLHDAYRAGLLRPGEVTEAVIARGEEIQAKLNIFAVFDKDGARAQAAASDRRWRDGTPLGRMDGVPITVKDNIPVEGLQVAWGSKLYLGKIAERDELPVARLRAQGSVILGKTTCSEFTLGRGTLNTLAFGVTRNPWNPALTTGASTGGGAAAAAAGVGPIAIGTDGGGSIRRPAGYCNLVGIKPSTGRVARLDGLPIIMDDFEIIGPLTRTVDDLALALAAMQGPDVRDRASLAFAADDGEPKTVKPLRIRYLPRFGTNKVEPEIVDSCAAAIRNLERLGHRVEEGPVPFDLELFQKYWPKIPGAGLAWLLRDEAWQGKIHDMYVQMMDIGKAMSAADYIDALTAFREIGAQIAKAFDDFDLLMTPSAGAMPWKAEDFGPPYHGVFTSFANASGVPAINIPCDPSPAGVPIGFHLVAPYGADWLLVAVARQYEQHHPWAQRRPAI